MWRWAKQAVLGLGLLVAAGRGAEATVVLQLGTEGRAKSWTGVAAGCDGALAFEQRDQAIGLGGSLITGAARCLAAGGMVVTETFDLPLGATNIRLRIEDFELFGTGGLWLNGRSVLEGDGKDVDDGKTAGAALVPGRNSLSIVIGGTGGGKSDDWDWDKATVLLQASLTYDATPVLATGVGSAAAAVPEPPGWAVFGVGFAGLAYAVRRRFIRPG